MIANNKTDREPKDARISTSTRDIRNTIAVANPNKLESSSLSAPNLNLPIRFKTEFRTTVWDVLRDRGWKEVDGSDGEWDFYWASVTWVHEQFDHIYLAENQKINHYRNHYELTRKDLLVKNVKRMIRTVEKEYGKAESSKFDFISTSYALPQEHALFQEEFKRNSGGVWIMKPVGKAQGKGIFLINKLSQISNWKKDPRLRNGKANTIDSSEEGPEAYIVQRYIDNPYLIGGKKFDIRIYVLVTSYYPLQVYIHRNGFCRFSNTQFSMNSKDISNLCINFVLKLDIHATNVAIQKTAPNYDSDKGCKWLLRNLKLYLVSKHGKSPVDALFTEMEALIVRSLMSVQKVMINDKHCFELYGYDILIDNDLKPWLLEVNASPSLSAETQFDYDLKYGMLSDLFDVIDLEKKFVNEKRLRTRVGGFDLVYNDGPIKQEKTSNYASYLGSYNPVIRAPRIKKRFAASMNTLLSIT